MWYLPIVVGVAGGALSAFLSWLKGTDALDIRKLSYGMIRGGILGAGIAARYEITDEMSYVLLFLSAGMFDQILSAGTKAFSKVYNTRKNQ